MPRFRADPFDVHFEVCGFLGIRGQAGEIAPTCFADHQDINVVGRVALFVGIPGSPRTEYIGRFNAIGRVQNGFKDHAWAVRCTR